MSYLTLCLIFVWSFGALRAHGDTLLNKYTVSTSCSPDAPGGTQGTATIRNHNVPLAKGASCAKTNLGFTRFNLTAADGVALRADKVFGLQSGDLLIMPPLQQSEFQPIFTVNTSCPAEDQSVNWVTVQWNDGAITLNNTYLLGTADVTPSGSVTIRTQFDVNGTLLGRGRYDGLGPLR